MQLKLADGAELFYTIADFTDPWKEAEALVLVYGMAKTHRLWYAWVPILAAHYRVVRFDLRGHGQSTAAPPGYPLSLDGLANDLLQLADGLGLEKFHLIGETVGGTISMNFATLHQERLLSLALCTAPSHFTHPHRLQVAEEIEKEGVAAFVERTIAGRLDPQIVDSAHTKWYTSEMAATPVHIWAGFARLNAGADLRPLLRDVRTPTLYLAAQGLEGTRRGDFRETTDLFPNGRLVVFPGVSGYVHHSMPEACANAWLDFAGSLKVPGD